MNKWQDLFDNRTARVVEGAGFTVRLYSLGNLRYSEGGRSITLLTEIVDETDQPGRKWLIFPRVSVVVYQPSSLTWDDGTPLEAGTTPVVIGRIQGAIEATGESSRIEVSDQIYQQAQRDWEQLGATLDRERSP